MCFCYSGLSEKGVRDGAENVEEYLSRAVDAIKIMYGSPYIIEHNLLEQALQPGWSTAERSIADHGSSRYTSCSQECIPETNAEGHGGAQ